MAFLPVGAGRVPFLLNQTLSQANLTERQQALTKASQQLSTGRRINLPSDDPSAALQVAVLQASLRQKEQFSKNIDAGSNALSVTESALRTISDAAVQAKGIALDNNTTLKSAGERDASRLQIDEMINNLLNVANQKYQNRYLFAGHQIITTPFERDGDFIVYQGDRGVLQALDGQDSTFDLSISADSGIGTESLAGRGLDLNPKIDGTTRLEDLNGGRGVGVGGLIIDVGGGPVIVDLSSADTVQDVLDQINSAVGPGTASIDTVAGNRLVINSGGPNLTVTDIAGGTTARDLGLQGVNVLSPLYGTDVNPTLSPTTSVASLNLAAPLGTLTIANGPHSANIDLSGATTVEDILNRINSANLRVRAEINDSKTGINVVSVLSGASMTITGATAQTLGVATTTSTSPLADFNDGAGIRQVAGDDLQVTTRSGATYSLDLEGVKNVADLQSLFAAKTGGQVTVSIGAGGGLLLSDATAGAGNFSVANLNGSSAATDLGIEQSVAGPSITGTNQYRARVKGIFDSLLRLRNGLANGDLGEIVLGGQQLDEDQSRTLTAAGGVGARLQILEQAKSRLDDEMTQNKSDTAALFEPDLSESITSLLQQQNILQAALSTTSRLLQRSLLDFL